MKIAIIGHSHIVAVLDAIGQWRAPANLEGGPADNSLRGWRSVNTAGKLFEVIPRERYKSLRGLQVTLINPGTINSADPAHLVEARLEGRHLQFNVSNFFLKFMESTSDFDVVISVLGGALTGKALVNDLPEYDFAPFESGQNSYRPIDNSYVNQFVAEDVNIVLAPLMAMRLKLTKPRLVHVAPPPPPKDLSKTRVFDNLVPLVNQYGWLRPSLRLKWYSFYLSHLRAAVSKQGITLIEPGREAVSEDGFLRPDFSEDLTHGNIHYGEVIADKIATCVEA